MLFLPVLHIFISKSAPHRSDFFLHLRFSSSIHLVFSPFGWKFVKVVFRHVIGPIPPCAGAPFLTGNLLVVGLWFGRPLRMTSRERDRYLSAAHIYVLKTRPSSAPVSGVKYRTSFVLTFCRSVRFLPTSSLSVSPALPCSRSFTPSHSPNGGVSCVLSRSSFWDRCQLQTKDIKKQ